MTAEPMPPQTASLRVLVIGRQPIARAGLRGLLGELGDALVVGVGSSIEDAGMLVSDLRPDVVLAAWEQGDVNAVVALAETLGSHGAPLVLFGDAPPPPDLTLALRNGVRGFLLTDASAEDVGSALRAVARGFLVLPPVLGRALPVMTPLAAPELGAAEPGDEQPLTDREREVLQLLALGLPNKAIARQLNVSEHTIKFHVGSILAKLSAGSRTEAVTRAARRGILAL
jgi:DNA-binding NarL/FixJ family response regulator